MYTKDRTIGRSSTDLRKSGGTGWLMIPDDVDEKRFIINCFRTNTVSLLLEDGSFLNRIPIDPLVLQLVDFPEKKRELGSQVVWVNIPPHNLPTIVSRVSKRDEFSSVVSGQILFTKRVGECSFTISGDANKGDLTLIVEGDSSSTLNLQVNHKGKQGQLNLFVQGDTKIFSTGNTELQSERDTIVKAEKHLFDKAEQSGVLGNVLKEFLDDLVTEIGSSTVTTSIGVMPLLNASQILAFKNRTSKLLSEKFKLE